MAINRKLKMVKWNAVFVLFMSLLMQACMVPKKVVYMENMAIDTNYQVKPAPALRIQQNDRLRIVVDAKNPELAIPFNNRMGTYHMERNGEMLPAADAASSGNSFLVDDAGTIDFPILGKTYVQGMTLAEIEKHFRDQLKQEGLIAEPAVKAELLNLKVNILGAVNRVGVLDVPDGRITLLEVIAKAGGLSPNAAPDQIAVIREVDGVRQKIVHDITTVDIFESPAYYLQQNDIVYVAPKVGDITSREQNNRTFVTTGISLATLVFTFLNWIK